MHFQGSVEDEKSGPDKFVVFVVVAQDMAYVLTEETLNALSKLLHAFDVLLLHVPAAVSVVRFSRFEWFDFLLDPEVPRDVGDKVFQDRERAHRLTVTGSARFISLSRVIHINLGIPLISAEQLPHLPALQFQRQAKSLALSAWIW